MNQKQILKNWLKEDCENGKCVMSHVIDLYSFVEDFFLKNDIKFQLSFEISLIKFAWFMFVHSNRIEFSNTANHFNNTEHDDLIQELYFIFKQRCEESAYPFLVHQNPNTGFEFRELMKELI